MNDKDWDRISGKIKDLFAKEPSIIALYVYGSILTDKFNPQKSDIDILIISRDLADPVAFIRRLKIKGDKFSAGRLDINLVFLSEFKNRWHIYRPPSYFLGIKYRHRLIFGRDLLVSVKDRELTVSQVYKRVVDLAQGSRGVYINGKEADFWRKKYAGWLRLAILEVLFLAGEFDLSFDTGVEKLIKKNKALAPLRRLKKPDLALSEINELAEKLRVHIHNNLLKSDR